MSLQNNPYKLTSQVSLAPDPQLASMMEHYKGSGDAVSFSVVFNEVQRRKEIRDAAQSKMSGGPKQKVADQLIQEAKQAQMPAPPQGQPPQGGPPQGGPPQGGPPPGPPQEGGPPPDMGMGPQGGPPQEGGPPPDMAMGPQEGGPPQGMADGGYLLPEDTGIAQLPARNLENMAGGGLVSFAYGGDISGYAGGGDLYVGAFGESGIPYRRGYAPPQEPVEERPRLDSRGDYRADLDRINAAQEVQDRDYKTGREALGKAYANAEERDKEMTQRYSDEERSVKGQALMNFGLNLMQSRQRGLAGIGAAGLAALPQYISGKKELSSLKDRQRDYMQTVAEARRGEKLGLLKDMYGLSTDRTGRRIAQAGVEAQLGQSDRELSSRERIAAMARNAKEGVLPSTDKLKSYYQSQYTDALEKGDTNRAAMFKARLEEFSNTLNSTDEKREIEVNKYLANEATGIRSAVSQYNRGNENMLKSMYSPVSNWLSYEEFLTRVLGTSTESGSSAGGGKSSDPFRIRKILKNTND